MGIPSKTAQTIVAQWFDGSQKFATLLQQSYLKLPQNTANYQKSGWKKKAIENPQAVVAQGFSLVTRRGFEPRTHCLKGSCSAD